MSFALEPRRREREAGQLFGRRRHHQGQIVGRFAKAVGRFAPLRQLGLVFGGTQDFATGVEGPGEGVGKGLGHGATPTPNRNVDQQNIRQDRVVEQGVVRGDDHAIIA